MSPGQRLAGGPDQRRSEQPSLLGVDVLGLDIAAGPARSMVVIAVVVDAVGG